MLFAPMLFVNVKCESLAQLLCNHTTYQSCRDYYNVKSCNKTPGMHRDMFHLQLTNNRRLIESLPPWQNAIYFGYNVKIRI